MVNQLRSFIATQYLHIRTMYPMTMMMTMMMITMWTITPHQQWVALAREGSAQGSPIRPGSD